MVFLIEFSPLNLKNPSKIITNSKKTISLWIILSTPCQKLKIIQKMSKLHLIFAPSSWILLWTIWSPSRWMLKTLEKTSKTRKFFAPPARITFWDIKLSQKFALSSLFSFISVFLGILGTIFILFFQFLDGNFSSDGKFWFCPPPVKNPWDRPCLFSSILMSKGLCQTAFFSIRRNAWGVS